MGLKAEIWILIWGWHLGLKVGIWATRLEFDHRSKDLGFKAHIVASMLKLGLMAWISPWRPGFGSKGVRGNVEGVRERYPYTGCTAPTGTKENDIFSLLKMIDLIWKQILIDLLNRFYIFKKNDDWKVHWKYTNKLKNA